MSKQQIIRFPLTRLYESIPMIISRGFQKTGAEFSVQVTGTQDAVSKVLVTCDGKQVSVNSIPVESFTNLDGSLRDDIVVFIFHSQEHGVHISLKN